MTKFTVTVSLCEGLDSNLVRGIQYLCYEIKQLMNAVKVRLFHCLSGQYLLSWWSKASNIH
jgi:hypothetical protein